SADAPSGGSDVVPCELRAAHERTSRPVASPHSAACTAGCSPRPSTASPNDPCASAPQAASASATGRQRRPTAVVASTLARTVLLCSRGPRRKGTILSTLTWLGHASFRI